MATEMETPPACAASIDHERGVVHAQERSVDAKEGLQEDPSPFGVSALFPDLALIGITVSVYLCTLYPSVAGGDSGELVAEACHLGVAHPPGYPLFTMLVHFVTSIPLATHSPAWRANAFSAVCDSLAAWVMYRSLLIWTSAGKDHTNACKTAAFTATALFAFSPLVWTYAVGAEVFALNNLFTAALIHMLLRFAIQPSHTRACQGALLCGLALTNQHTIVLFELPIIVFVLVTRGRQSPSEFLRELPQLAICFIVGLVPYVYLPVVARWWPQQGSWGEVASLPGLVHHMRRADYGTFRLFATNEATEAMATRLYLYAVDLSSREMPLHLALPLGLLGAGVSLLDSNKQRVLPSVGSVLVATYTFYMLVFHALSNLPLDQGLTYGVHMRFWQQPNVIIFLWVGVALHKLLDVISTGSAHEKGTRVGDIRTGLRVRGTLARVGLLGLVGAQVTRWYEVCDQSEARYIPGYAAALLDPLPKNAVLVVNFDLQWTSLRYLQRCEHRRPDVTVLNLSMMTYRWFATKHELYPGLHFPGPRLVPFGTSLQEGFTFASFLDANYANRSPRDGHSGIFFGGKLTYQDDRDLHAKYTFVPYGLLDEVVAVTPSSVKATPTRSLSRWYKEQREVQSVVRRHLPHLPPADKYDDETWEWTIARDHGMKALSWSTYLLERTIDEDPHNVSLLAEATHALEQSYQFEPATFWDRTATLKNLGLAYAQIIKARQEFVPTNGDPFFNDIVGDTVADPSKYKDRAAARLLQVWSAWLREPEARRDPGYFAIQGIVNKFVLTEATQTPPAHETTKKTKKKKKPVHKSKNKKTKRPAKHKSNHARDRSSSVLDTATTTVKRGV